MLISGFQVFIVAVADNGIVAVAKADPTPHNDCITTYSLTMTLCINWDFSRTIWHIKRVFFYLYRYYMQMYALWNYVSRVLYGTGHLIP